MRLTSSPKARPRTAAPDPRRTHSTSHGATLTRALLGCALLASPLMAQSIVVPALATPDTGGCNTFPFSSATSIRYQVLITSADLNNTAGTIHGLELAPCGSGVRSMATITIKMAHFTGATLSSVFATNISPLTPPVLDSVDYRWLQTADVWNEIGLQDPFAYDGTSNLVVDIVITGSAGASAAMHRDVTNQRIFRTGYTNQPTGIDGGLTAIKLRLLMGDANTGLFGAGCVGSNGTPAFSFAGTAKLGNTLGFDCVNAPLFAPTILIAGTDSRLSTYPWQLPPLLYPGCTLYHDVLFAILALADGSGHALVQVPIPDDPSLLGLVVYSSYVVQDPLANLGGLTLSNYGRALLGN